VTAISYTLLIEGAPAEPELLERIQHVECEEHAHLADIVRIRLALSVNSAGSDWNFETNLFPRLGKIRLVVTVGTQSLQLIEARIIETECNLSNTPGKSTLDVIAMDCSVLMHLEEKVRPWPNMTDSDIATAIFGEHGFEVDVEQTETAWEELDTTVIQRGTDMQFLRELAQRNGFDCYVDLNRAGQLTGHFHPARLNAPVQGVLTVNMGDATNVNEFQARFDMLRPTQVRATGLDIGSQTRQDADAGRAAQKNLGGSTPHDSDRPRLTLVTQSGLQRTGELQTLAQALVDRSAWAVTAEGELNPAAYGGVLRARRLVSVRGAGRLFSGEYFVDKVTHLFDGNGYSQRFGLRRNAQGLTGQENFTEEQAEAS
jgi:phage protein D